MDRYYLVRASFSLTSCDFSASFVLTQHVALSPNYPIIQSSKLFLSVAKDLPNR